MTATSGAGVPSFETAPLEPPARTGETTMPLLEVRDLHVHFQGGGRIGWRANRDVIRAVDGVSLTIERGETLGLVGESGSGKTTAGRAIVRLLDPTSGSIRFDGQEIATLRGEPLRRLRQRFQMIFQDPYSSLNPRMTVRSIVEEPLDIHAIGSRQERLLRVTELLELVGLSPRAAERFPHEFSGGQRQRIGIARALALNPDLIVADEPISALDVSIRAQILALMERLQAELHLTYLVVAHDLAIVRRISDRVAVMYLGRIVEMAPTRDLYGAPLHPYTVALLSAVPIPDPQIQMHRRRIILGGEIPSPANPPPGCHFHTRCWLYQRLETPEVCRTVAPPLQAAATSHQVACHFADRIADSAEQRQAVGRVTATAAPATGAQP